MYEWKKNHWTTFIFNMIDHFVCFYSLNTFMWEVIKIIAVLDPPESILHMYTEFEHLIWCKG